MSSKASVELPSGYAEISQETNYPFEGTVKITYHGNPAQVAVRIPAWYDGCLLYTSIVLSLNRDDNPTVDNQTPSDNVETTTQAGNLATSPTVKIEDDTDIADLYEDVYKRQVEK